MTTTLAKRTNMDDYHACHPEIKKLHETQVRDICKKIVQFRKNLDQATNRFVSVAEFGRQIGLAIIEFIETLPGKKLTEDFWEGDGAHFKDAFREGTGRSIERDELEWFVKIARKYPGPITSVLEAFQCRQPLLLASGDEEYKLQGEREPQNRHEGIDAWGEVTEWIEKVDIFERKWREARQDTNYFPGGHIRSDLKETWAEQWKPKLAALDAFREELRQELGI